MERIYWSSDQSLMTIVGARINGHPANSENKQMNQSELEERKTRNWCEKWERSRTPTQASFSVRMRITIRTVKTSTT